MAVDVVPASPSAPPFARAKVNDPKATYTVRVNCREFHPLVGTCRSQLYSIAFLRALDDLPVPTAPCPQPGATLSVGRR